MRRLLLLAVVVPTGCDDHLYGTTDAICREDAPLTWENFGQTFMHHRCAGCHSSLHGPDDRADAPMGVDFDTWAGTLLWAERVHERVITQTMPPPNGGLPPLERAMFDEWMRCEVLPAAGAL